MRILVVRAAAAVSTRWYGNWLKVPEWRRSIVRREIRGLASWPNA